MNYPEDDWKNCPKITNIKIERGLKWSAKALGHKVKTKMTRYLGKIFRKAPNPNQFNWFGLPLELQQYIIQKLAFTPQTFELFLPQTSHGEDHELTRVGFGCINENYILRACQVHRLWRREILKYRTLSLQITGPSVETSICKSHHTFYVALFSCPTCWDVLPATLGHAHD